MKHATPPQPWSAGSARREPAPAPARSAGLGPVGERGESRWSAALRPASRRRGLGRVRGGAAFGKPTTCFILCFGMKPTGAPPEDQGPQDLEPPGRPERGAGYASEQGYETQRSTGMNHKRAKV